METIEINLYNHSVGQYFNHNGSLWCIIKELESLSCFTGGKGVKRFLAENRNHEVDSILNKQLTIIK